MIESGRRPHFNGRKIQENIKAHLLARRIIYKDKFQLKLIIVILRSQFFIMGNQTSSDDNAFDDIVLPSKSSLGSETKTTEPPIKIKELWIYPVKVSHIMITSLSYHHRDDVEPVFPRYLIVLFLCH